MPRSERVDYPGARHHVMNRGARQQTVFHDDDCALRFLELIGELPERFSVKVHGNCLAT